jgi:Na+-translocating ferredoxin:NAD+ oxidoreductase RnfG subunit/Pyruvate/2-oxoacid:ferredoxin oxidoreductase delta subunit
MKILEHKKTMIIIAACLFLVLAAVYQQISNKLDTLSLLKQVEPDAAQYHEVKGSYPTYELLDEDGQFLNYAVISSSSGYGGPITTVTSINKEGSIASVAILDHAETPSYINRVLNEGYPDNFQGKSISERLADQEGIDAISGATRTSEGIIGSVEKGMVEVGENQLGIRVPQLDTVHFQWQDGVIVLLLILMVLAVMRKMRKLRPWLLVASVIVIGFLTKTSLTVGNFTSILANKIPSIGERPVWFILVIGVLLITLISGKNLYCGWLCPFGAVQEGIYKALNLKSFKINQNIVKAARKSRWIFIWLAAMLALIFNNPGITSYEPFSAFFGGEATTSQWIVMGIVLLMSIFVLRFWCRSFCPVGAVLDAIASGKRKIKRLFAKKQMDAAQKVSSCSGCNTCKSGCRNSRVDSLSWSERFFAGIIILVDLLIIATLLQNIGLV